MSSQKRAEVHFNARRLDPQEFSVGHLSDDTARLYARDLFLIGYVEESQILSGNDVTRYTAIFKKDNGHACEVFFDLACQAEAQAQKDARGRKFEAQVSH